ncbi:exodeoxyribonuclease V subunit gamma [Nocardia sp. CDC159]|uniref:RecBCD enzyme subunit RecC n=1 Tax=Nocardia pulmonis TaxID=2951408 RepID=A0A9X2E658_9NOCA|nr:MULTISPECIES: exodeoxyribonuclease V subunit gamma [Nocardia]MCM6772258.1 exodeoxyribonuclease V subunit gamma [Nocardia pulmonis]MCM6785084.1 exodeoxyribonuclease V subunit gamma [Nocardia sp. CDC159]
MALHIHRAERAETLADGLAAVLAHPLDDPFAVEVVAVPAKGVERWLNQRLAGVLGAVAGDGVSANIAFPTPAALVAGILAEATGIPADEDPWVPGRLVWTLLRVIDAALTEPWAALLARHLGADAPGRTHRAGRRYATAARLAALFDGYATQRPTLLIDWSAGHDTDGCGHPLPEDLRWQPELFRRLRTELATPSPAERLPVACARLRTASATLALPQRISLFGLTRLTTDQLAVLAAVAEHRDVHLWLPHPSPALWAKLGTPLDSPVSAASRDSSVSATCLDSPARTKSGPGASVPRAADGSALRVAHPLLAALGRDVRELQVRLGEVGEAVDTHHGGGESSSRTLLSELQAGIRDDRWPPEADAGLADGSVRVHSCHGPARQVEVLRDVLLGIFAADPTVQPRDVVVLCPDVENYGPLVRAAFGHWQVESGGGPGHPAHGLRVRMADRSSGEGNPVLGVLGDLLGLADGRVTITQVLDLASAEPVRLRCGLDEDDIERLREWAAETGARWGIGQRQRQAFGLGEFAQNTLNAAVDRILLGVAAGESSEDWLDLALPLEDVDSADVDLAGRFAEFTDRLAVIVRDLRGPTPAEPSGSQRPAHEWAQVLGRALDLLTDTTYAQSWQGVEARREVAAALEHAGSVPLRLPDIGALLRDRLAGRSARANFRTGELTVCTLAPLRSVPHRVVVLLGLDDEVFPRASGIDGDDVLSREPLVGERDPRGEDRQLLLDAIMAARERLVVLHTGADPVTGAHRPPAIPVAELLDTLRALTGSLDGVVVRHPLQPFDIRNFDAAEPFSFDAVALAGARAATGPIEPQPRFLPGPLAAPARVDVELAELISFAEHPVRAFLWQRLGIRVPEEEEEIDERLPIELDGLTKWNMGERMLAARLTGADPAALRAAEWRRGTLPPFGLGAAVLDEVENTVDRLVRVARPIHELPSRTLDIAVDLGDGRLLSGTVPDVHDDAVVRTTFSRLAPKHRIAAWVRLLALAATERNQGWRAITIGRGKFNRPAWRSILSAPNAAAAQAILRDLAELRDEGLIEPLPITPTATAVYAERRCQGASIDDARLAAEQEFLGGPNGPKAFGDHTDRYLRYVWGPSPRLDTLDTPLTDPDPSGETTRFGSLARRLWNPLLANESQGQP